MWADRRWFLFHCRGRVRARIFVQERIEQQHGAECGRFRYPSRRIRCVYGQGSRSNFVSVPTVELCVNVPTPQVSMISGDVVSRLVTLLLEIRLVLLGRIRIEFLMKILTERFFVPSGRTTRTVMVSADVSSHMVSNSNDYALTPVVLVRFCWSRPQSRSRDSMWFRPSLRNADCEAGTHRFIMRRTFWSFLRPTKNTEVRVRDSGRSFSTQGSV